MKVALAQLNPIVGDLSGNGDRLVEAAQTAAADGVRLLIGPELSLCGYPPRDLLVRPSFIAATGLALEGLRDRLPPDIAVLVGVPLPNPQAGVAGGRPLFNSAVLIDGGRIAGTVHKRLLPTYDVFDEDRYFEAGTAPGVIELDGQRIGVTICEDIWNDEEFWGRRQYAIDPVADLVAANVSWIANLSASPFACGKPKLREEMVRHCARRHGVAIAYVNQVGSNDDLVFDGSSVAVTRTGEVAARGAAFGTDLVTIAVTPDGEVTTPDATPIPEAIAHPEAELWAALVLGVRDYARKCNFSQIVLGLSGGIDSSLVAAIAAAAVGGDRVLGVLMPSPYSSQGSIDDAIALADVLGLQRQTLAIGDLMEGYDRRLADLFDGLAPGIAEENLQSRIRGNLLMAIANKFGHLLLSTGNKSEMAVGYCTLYGDMNGGLAAIADVPKTRVFALCHWLNGGQEGCPDGLRLKAHGLPIPINVLEKPPSAELRPDQKDTDSLPPYEVLDDILDRLVGQSQSPADAIAAGHDSATVQRILHLLARAEFKRRQAPPVLKVTDRAFGVGWRMPIASRWQVEAPQPQ
ncbi:MAG: NAD+ synthase [Cyanobacteria bacterium]|nr:NAD+ synthase [Cyanobacteriota bacterium]